MGESVSYPASVLQQNKQTRKYVSKADDAKAV